MAIDGFFEPLPFGQRDLPDRGGKYLDIEVFGSIYAESGVIGGDVTIEGSLIGNVIYSSNWVSGGGTVPLSLPDSGASSGFALDGASGKAQFQTIYAEGGEIGNLVLTGGLEAGDYTTPTDSDSGTLLSTGLISIAQGGNVTTNSSYLTQIGTTYYDSTSGSPADTGTIQGWWFGTSSINVPARDIADPDITDLDPGLFFVDQQASLLGTIDEPGWWLTGLAGDSVNTNLDINVGGDVNVDGDIYTADPGVLFARGSLTSSVANTSVDVEWNTPVSISTAHVEIDSTNNEEIVFNTAGTYLIDVTVRTTNNNRTELILQAYVDTGSGFTAQTRQIASDYVARDTDQNTGGVDLHVAYEASAGDKYKIEATGDCDGTSTLMQSGTLLRVTRAT